MVYQLRMQMLLPTVVLIDSGLYNALVNFERGCDIPVVNVTLKTTLNNYPKKCARTRGIQTPRLHYTD